MTHQATRHMLHVVVDHTGFSIEEEYSAFLKTHTAKARRIIYGPFRHLDKAEDALMLFGNMTPSEFKAWLLTNNFPILTGTIPFPSSDAPPVSLLSVTLDVEK